MIYNHRHPNVSNAENAGRDLMNRIFFYPKGIKRKLIFKALFAVSVGGENGDLLLTAGAERSIRLYDPKVMFISIFSFFFISHSF